jgi:hypothetical protein
MQLTVSPKSTGDRRVSQSHNSCSFSDFFFSTFDHIIHERSLTHGAEVSGETFYLLFTVSVKLNSPLTRNVKTISFHYSRNKSESRRQESNVEGMREKIKNANEHLTVDGERRSRNIYDGEKASKRSFKHLVVWLIGILSVNDIFSGYSLGMTGFFLSIHRFWQLNKK